ncbi:HNH endonuclease [Salmonella enterica]|nr:HNH endonuclease [Salmonella enterica]
MARFIYTPEMKAWMQDNYLLRMDKLSVAFNAHFGTTRSSESLNGLRKRLKLRTGRRGCFTPGSIPANKGTRGVMKVNRGSFKKGNRPGNTARVGDETLTDDGYIRVKVAEPNRWELKHRLVWEKYRGEIPENGVIRFIDDNRRNCDIDNLMLVTKADSAVMNRWYSGSSPEYRQTTLAMAQIKLAITRRQRDTK